MNLLIRADANVAMGTGHVMRCLALAQAWQDAGGCAAFAMSEAPAAIGARLNAESCDILPIVSTAGSADDAALTMTLARERGTDWVVVDGYQFSADYQRRLKDAGFRILFVDDYGHAQWYSADLVLNQNVYANETIYAGRAPNARLLLGPRYGLLRREFVKWPGRAREIPEIARKILVTMGGSDPDNFTLRTMKGLEQFREWTLDGTILVGGSNPNGESLQQAALESRHRWRLEINATNVPGLMEQCDLAISAAGSTCLELCRMGLPAVLIDLAQNQTPIAREFARRGTAIHLGSLQDVTETTIAVAVADLLRSKERRRKMSELGRAVVDGTGAERVVAEIRQFS